MSLNINLFTQIICTTNSILIKFNSINEIMENKLHTVNSFSNGGAMATTSLLYEKNQKKFKRIGIHIFFNIRYIDIVEKTKIFQDKKK